MKIEVHKTERGLHIQVTARAEEQNDLIVARERAGFVRATTVEAAVALIDELRAMGYVGEREFVADGFIASLSRVSAGPQRNDARP